MTLTNDGPDTLTISSPQSQLGYFTITNVSATTIAPGQTATISIAARAPIVGIDKPGTYNDNLLVKTNELNNPTRMVPVSVKISGASLAFVDANNAPITALSIVGDANNCHNPGVVYGVTNTGDIAANVDYPTPGQNGYTHVLFTAEGFGGVQATGAVITSASVGPGATVKDTAIARSQDGMCSGTDSFTYSTSTSPNICIGLPALPITYGIPGSNGPNSCAYCC